MFYNLNTSTHVFSLGKYIRFVLWFQVSTSFKKYIWANTSTHSIPSIENSNFQVKLIQFRKFTKGYPTQLETKICILQGFGRNSYLSLLETSSFSIQITNESFFTEKKEDKENTLSR